MILSFLGPSNFEGGQPWNFLSVQRPQCRSSASNMSANFTTSPSYAAWYLSGNDSMETFEETGGGGGGWRIKSAMPVWSVQLVLGTKPPSTLASAALVETWRLSAPKSLGVKTVQKPGVFHRVVASSKLKNCGFPPLKRNLYLVLSSTLPETNSLPLKTGWETLEEPWRVYFQGRTGELVV